VAKGDAAAGAFDAILKDSQRARLGGKAQSQPSPEFLLSIGFGPAEEDEEDDEDEEE